MRARGQKPVLVVQARPAGAPWRRSVGGLIPVVALEEIPETMTLQVVQTAEPARAHG